MLLYTEKQLDVAYRIDCKARSQSNEPWIKREDFRPLYEDLIESYMIAYKEDDIFPTDIPEYLIDSVNDLLSLTLTTEN
jgi:hypothetical protein|tara:strand:- start:1493 stop:1729 length:237 start_codon:yes stop_codon:yes gene_type:complete